MPVYGGPKSDDRLALQNATLETMGTILGLDSIACQESALHGLGHWHGAFPEQTEALIVHFLQARAEISSTLRSYAQSARCGASCEFMGGGRSSAGPATSLRPSAAPSSRSDPNFGCL